MTTWQFSKHHNFIKRKNLENGAGGDIWKLPRWDSSFQQTCLALDWDSADKSPSAVCNHQAGAPATSHFAALCFGFLPFLLFIFQQLWGMVSHYFLVWHITQGPQLKLEIWRRLFHICHTENSNILTALSKCSRAIQNQKKCKINTMSPILCLPSLEREYLGEKMSLQKFFISQVKEHLNNFSCLIYHHALPLIILFTSQPGGTTLAMRWALAGFTAIKTKAASQLVLSSPRSLQEKSSGRVGHRETGMECYLLPCGSQPCPLLMYKPTPYEPPGVCSPAARKLSLPL